MKTRLLNKSENDRGLAARPQTNMMNSYRDRSSESAGPMSQSLHGNRALGMMISGGLIMPKLKVGPVNDVYEQEADRVAEQVMRMPEPCIQRKPG